MSQQENTHLVLVSEGSPSVGAFIERTLADTGQYQVHLVSNFDELPSMATALRPEVALVDVTTANIASGAIDNLFASGQLGDSVQVILTFGYIKSGLGKIDELKAAHPQIKQALKKPFTPEQLLDATRECVQSSDAATNAATLSASSGETPSGQGQDFGPLLEREGVLCYSVTNADGSVVDADGKDCGELSEPTAYFANLGTLIGQELGLENQKEFHVYGENCRLLSVRRPDGKTVDMMATPEVDIVRTIRTAQTL